ncbi:Bifunctional dihydrofolate reductase-thymidylate synthase [Hibiscus syriacus]|uniref:thymidylate synthase n=1 Tax=Hibiscus syriacus TaxID=106335 RepID=A0A6A2Z4C3_HIBSY|nr:Bifunctional dihydrofolate reductase-thymidylate synthase [Hibiscus syriacus]
MHADYTGQGFDQLLDVIVKIKNNPNDRRIILSAWNPSDLKLMALPPCHMFAQFYVANGNYHAKCDFIHVLVILMSIALMLGPYKSSFRNCQSLFQLSLIIHLKIILKINPEKKNIDSFVSSDFELIGYDPHKKIEMKMAV